MPPRKSSQKTSPTRTGPKQAQPVLEEVVDPRWLLKALGLTLIAAVVCAWLVLCLLYYQGSWQLVLQPSHTVDRTPAEANLPFELVHFDASETGQPRLTGWWIPAAANAAAGPLKAPPRYAAYTVLYLHNGSGSLSATLPTLVLLHSVGINVFAFDYRGFGLSDSSSHPTSESMSADTSSALGYLVSTRHLDRSRILPYGTGLGAALAVALAHDHGDLPAIIVDNPDPDPVKTAIAAHPSGIVPIRLLYHEHFEIAGPLRSLPTPKLLIAGGPNAQASKARTRELEALFRAAASPATSVALGTSNFEAPYLQALTRFLDQYLPAAPASR